MKELNFLKRLSAITLAAAITAANVGFDFLPTAKKAAAEPKEENTVTEVKTPKVMTQKSKYPTSLSFIVEKNEDGESVLRASNPTVFNRYFTAELISLDPPAEGEEAEQLVFSAEGTVIRKGGNYTVNVKERINEETGELVYNPYKIIGGGITIAEETAVPEAETINQEIAVIEDGEIVEEAAEILQEGVNDEIIPEEPAEIPVITETSVNICESDVNAANGMFDMSQSQKLDYTVVKSQDSYNVIIPDDYDELFLNGIDEEGNAFFNAAGEEVQVNFNEIEMNIQVVNFAELKIKDIAEPEDYSIERFCGEETLPYYYGEIVKVTPSSGYNIVVGDMKFSDAVSVAINDDAVTTEGVAINVYEGENISGNFTANVNGNNVTVTVNDNVPLNGMKYTLSVALKNGKADVKYAENKALTFSFDDVVVTNGVIRVNAAIEGVKAYSKLSESDEIKCYCPTEPLIDYVNGNMTDTTWYKNGKLTAARLSFTDGTVKINEVTIKSKTGKPYATYDANGKLTGGDSSIISDDANVTKGSWEFFINPAGVNNLHEDLYIDVDYTPIKEVKISFDVTPNDGSVIGKLNGTEFGSINIEKDLKKNDNIVEFSLSEEYKEKWTITRIDYIRNDTTAIELFTKFSIGTANEVKQHGDYIFTVTLEQKPVNVTVEYEENFGSIVLRQEENNIDAQNGVYSVKVGVGFELFIMPKKGYYVSSIIKNEKTVVYNATDDTVNTKSEFNKYKQGEVVFTDTLNEDVNYSVTFAEVAESSDIIAKITNCNGQIDQVKDENGDLKNEFNILDDSGSGYTLSFGNELPISIINQYADTYNFNLKEITRNLNAEETLEYYVANGNKIEKVKVIVKSVSTKPTITEFKIEKSTKDKILNILTFGIFSNDTIKLTVYANDDANNEFKISDIRLFNDGKDIDEENNIELQEVNGSYYKTFTLTESEAPYKLTAYAESELGTIKQKGTVYGIDIQEKDIYFDDESAEIKSHEITAVNDKDIHIVIENGKPTLNYESVKSIYKDDNNANQLKDVFSKSTDSLWVKDTAQFTFKAKDLESGIDAIKYRADNSEDWKTIDYSSDWNKEIPVNITLTTNDDVYENSLKVKSDKYEHTLDVIAIDHAGNESDVSSVPIHIDAAPPVIDNVKAYVLDDKGNPLEDYVGQWTNKNVRIDFTVTDNANNLEGSGVNSDTVKVNKVEYDENGNIISRIELLKPTNHENGDYSCTISPYFCENLTIYAEDNVENPFECPIGHIWTETNRPQISNFEIYKDGEKVEPQNGDYKYLFNLPAEARIQATDSDSGISQVKLKYIMADGTEGELIPTTYENNIAIFDLNDEVIQQSYYDGRFEFMAVDRAGNTTRLNEETDNPWIPHEMLVAENPEYHSGHSSAEISIPETLYSNGNPLYDQVPEITFSVKDTASGIKNIQYSIKGKSDKVSYTFFENASDKWGEPQKFNVYTYVEGKIDFSKIDLSDDVNLNNIEITLTAYDNAGNEIPAAPQTISIDKTPPEITSIKFNPAGSANQEFFNKQRTATVRAKDRNFNKDKLSELLEVTVTNALGTSAAPYKAKNQDWQKVTAIESDNVKDGEEVYECEITFVQDAEYSFAISAEDLTTQKSPKSETFKFTIDTTAPKLSITFDNNSKANDKYYNAGRKATLTINEHNFAKNKDSVKSVLSAKGADGLTAMDSKEIYDGKLTWTQSKTNKDEWTAQVNFNKEGTFDFSMAYTDPAGNSGNNADSGEFVIDTTAPKIEQSFTKSGNKLATNSDLVPHVIFSDYNFLSENQIGNNCKVTIRKFGENGLSSENFSATSRSYTSKNADSPVTFEQIFDIFDKEIEVDGIYEIAIRAEDLAGNVTEINDLTVSINRFGPTYMILNEEARKAVEKYAANEIPINDNIGLEIAEVNVTPLSGKGIVRVSVDGTSINELEDGFETSENRVSLADDVWEENENGWYQTIYKIDKKNFEKDGKYRVTLESEDEAGNKYLSDSATSPRTNFAASFAVDTTEPTIIIAGADEEEYKETELELTVKLSDINSYSIDELEFYPDNKDNSTFYVKINDDYHDIDSLKKQCEGEISKDASGDIVIKMMVKASEKNQKQIVDVFFKDKAGNQTIGTESFTLGNTNNWFMIIIIAAGVIILCTAVFFVTKKVRKR